MNGWRRRPPSGPRIRRRDDVPEGFDATGVPRAGASRDTLAMVGAVVVALAGLIFTLAYIVFHHLQSR